MKGLFRKLLAMRLKTKVMAGYAFMSFLIIGILAIVSVNFFRIKARYDSINAMSGDVQRIVELKTNINAVRAAFLRMALAKDQSTWDQQEAVIDFYIKKTNSDLEKLQNGAYKDQVSDIENSWTPFMHTIKGDLIPLVESGKLGQAMNILETKQAKRSRDFLTAANGIIDSSRAEFAKRLGAVKVYIRSTIISVITIVLVVFSASFIFTFLFINKYMIKVLRNIGASAQKIAAGDLTINLEAKTEDEFGELADDVNRIISAMKDVLRKIAGKTSYVLKDATNLTMHGNSVSQKVDKDLERTTTAAAATEEMSFTVGDIARNVNTASQSAE
nr:methyl-accepting chemotaxis protein [Nitrospiraceae bacterium]